MKKSFYVLTISVLYSAGALAFGLECRPVAGTFTVVPDPECQVISDRHRDQAFPALKFLAESDFPPEDSCFSGTFDLEIGGREYIGRASLGQTLNNYPPIDAGPQMFTAGDVVTMYSTDNTYGQPLGKLFLKHFALIDFSGEIPQFNEEVSVVSGTRYYTNAKGQLSIDGNLFAGADVSGEICTIW